MADRTVIADSAMDVVWLMDPVMKRRERGGVSIGLGGAAGPCSFRPPGRRATTVNIDLKTLTHASAGKAISSKLSVCCFKYLMSESVCAASCAMAAGTMLFVHRRIYYVGSDCRQAAARAPHMQRRY